MLLREASAAHWSVAVGGPSVNVMVWNCSTAAAAKVHKVLLQPRSKFKSPWSKNVPPSTGFPSQVVVPDAGWYWNQPENP